MRRYRASAPRPVLPRKTLDYLATGAAEGSRNAELFDAACQFRDAAYRRDEADAQLLPRAAADGLSEAETRHAIDSAYSQQPREPVLRGGPPPAAGAPPLPAKPPAPRPVTATPAALPEPLEDGFMKLLDHCFQPDEFVAIAPATENDEGEVVPTRGVTLARDEWKARAQAKGGIERCFTTTLGLFIRINPMQKDGAKNEHVAAFRHALVEFDRDEAGAVIPKERQLGVILGSGLPVSAVIDSGNKSLHAWVRVDAPDAAEYRRRVETVWALFSGCSLDKQNKNPSRLSRCPNGRRSVDGEVRVQRLLALKVGAGTWDEWEANQLEDELAEPLRVSQLTAYDTSHDPNNVLGNRWLCRGSSLVIVGQSGVGKSSLCMQLMILWALGLPAFNILPERPLRSLLIQAENDAGDLAEMYQGVRDGMKLTAEQERTLEDRIIIYRDTTHTGEGFTSLARRLVQRHQPDMAWADPLLNYIGDDISEQRVIAEFCCNRLNAIAIETGVIWCLLHHTGKPSKDPKATEHWTASDLAYSGLGSSALVNWSRETAVLLRVKTPDGQPPTFQLSMTKRRKRAGLRDVNGEPADTIFLRHSGHEGICWEQCISPVSEGKPGRYKSAKEPGRDSAFDAAAFQQVLADFGGEVSRKHEKEIATRLGVSTRSVWSYWKEFKKTATAQVAAATLAALFAANPPTKARCNNALQPLQESGAPASGAFTETYSTAARMLQGLLQPFTSCRGTAAKTLSPEPPFGGSGDFCSTGSGASGKEASRG